MDKQEAKNRIEKLKELIEKYRYSYHVEDKSLVPDSVNDSLKHELQDLENQFPEFVTKDSPTQRVGGKPLDKFSKVTHSRPMLSLVDAFNRQELEDWETRNKKLVDEDYNYFAELKMDGLAVSLVYENGIFIRGATRGDGKIGEDVTQNLKTIESIPLKLSQDINIEVRGEAYMSLETFEELNTKYKKEGKALLANPRNGAAGSIRQLNSKITAERKLSFVAWDLFGIDLKGHDKIHAKLAELGFKTIKENRLCANLDEVEKFIEEMDKVRQILPYQIDGIVVVINDDNIKKDLGVVGKAPRGMIAYKFAPEEATTIVEDIIVQVGRTGTLTPIAVLKPVLIAGSTVSRATLHNEDEIRKKDVRIGDTVIIHKAGDVIPEVEKPLKELRTGKEKEFHFPKTCPICGGAVVREEGKAAYKCVNKDCFTIQRRSLNHFVSKAAFDMTGLGPKIISKFFEIGLIKDAGDLFTLRYDDIKVLERFAEKSAQNVIETINNHKKISLPRFIYALGIPNVGEESSYDIALAIKSKGQISNSKEIIEKLKSQTAVDWKEIRDIGPIVAKSIYDYFNDAKNIKFLYKLIDNGVEIIADSPTSGKLAGKSFVFTGGLENITRDAAKDKVRTFGGEISESVSKTTSYVVVGTDPGSKYDKAQKLGVTILNEKDFLELIG